jgi:hypothetical protein
VFGRKSLEQKLVEQGGTVAWANVVEAKTLWTSGWNYENGPYTVGNNHHTKVKLQVEPDDEPAFEASFHQTFPGRIPIPGFQAKVIFDPNDHDKIAVLDGEIFPPGLSHEQAERSAQRHRELEQAAKDGNLAQFIQEQVRAGQAQAASGGQVLFSEGGPAFVVHPEGASSPQSSSAATSARDVADELKKLADLRDRGALTDAEFEQEKAKLLSS